MDAELKTKLNEYSKSKGWGEAEDDVDLFEILTEGKSVKEYDHDEHRWYTAYSQVVQIADFFVDFQNMTSTGDEPGFDTDDRQEEALRTAVEVFPKEVTVTDYVTKDKL